MNVQQFHQDHNCKKKCNNKLLLLYNMTTFEQKDKRKNKYHTIIIYT